MCAHSFGFVSIRLQIMNHLQSKMVKTDESNGECFCSTFGASPYIFSLFVSFTHILPLLTTESYAFNAMYHSQAHTSTCKCASLIIHTLTIHFHVSEWGVCEIYIWEHTFKSSNRLGDFGVVFFKQSLVAKKEELEALRNEVDSVCVYIFL